MLSSGQRRHRTHVSNDRGGSGQRRVCTLTNFLHPSIKFRRTDQVCLVFALEEDILEEFDLGISGGKHKARHLLNTLKLGDDLERVTLIDQETLAFGGEVHLLGVSRNE